MKKSTLASLLVAAGFLTALLPVLAQDSQSSSPSFVEVNPPALAPGIYDLVVPLEVMDKSKEDLADLRLYNAQGREIPYALRVRSEIDQNDEVNANVFNQSRIGATTSEMSVDLGETPDEHNAVEIETSGSNFRRRVDVEGGDSAKEWRTLKTAEVIFSFESQNKTVESKRITYPASRYRYLRLKVFADELSDKQPPVITAVKVMMSRREKGAFTIWSVPVPSYELLRNQGSPASAWTIDLGARVPCDRLTLEVDDDSFSRPFLLEAVDDPQNIRFVASGDLTRRIGEPGQPLTVSFKEVRARRLRLMVTDYSNQTLSIASIKPGAPQRQIVFELKDAAPHPLRLYFGDQKSPAPHYDFEKNLQSKLSAEPVRCEAGPVTANPNYTPEPAPLTERIPWLIYAVLAASSLSLGIILFSLARSTLRTAPPQATKPNTQSGHG